MKKNSMTGDVIAGYKMKENFDIDTEEDFLAASKVIANMKNAPK